MSLASGILYQKILDTPRNFAILIDPDKVEVNEVHRLVKNLPTITTHLLVGGSTVERGKCEAIVKALKACTKIPIVLFPGDYTQVTPEAQAILFLSLVSGENPEYLIGQQVKSAKAIKASQLEVISTAYLLIDGGKETAVQRVSQTSPMSQLDIDKIVSTCLASELAGKKIIYLEAGSGALFSVKPEIIKAVKKEVSIPIIVGGGLRTESQIEMCYEAGANMVVVGTAFEEQIKNMVDVTSRSVTNLANS